MIAPLEGIVKERDALTPIVVNHTMASASASHSRTPSITTTSADTPPRTTPSPTLRSQSPLHNESAPSISLAASFPSLASLNEAMESNAKAANDKETPALSALQLDESSSVQNNIDNNNTTMTAPTLSTTDSVLLPSNIDADAAVTNDVHISQDRITEPASLI